MKNAIRISGFADEIDPDFRKQLKTVTDLGMHYISLRSANAKNIAEYTAMEVEQELLPVLQEYGVGVSSLGSPIGKIPIDDEEAYAKQSAQLKELCQIAKVLDCKYVRIFSFFMPKGKDPDDYKEQVHTKMERWVETARAQGVILLHENEKEIYGDTGARCLELLKFFDSPTLRAAFDFANFVQCKEDTQECWNLLQPYIEYIHIKDAVYENNENVVCGTGDGKVEKLLRCAIVDEGYEGFLTLEPHLVVFDSLSSLENKDVKEVIKKNKASNGAEGYAMQYHALCDILSRI